MAGTASKHAKSVVMLHLHCMASRILFYHASLSLASNLSDIHSEAHQELVVGRTSIRESTCPPNLVTSKYVGLCRPWESLALSHMSGRRILELT